MARTRAKKGNSSSQSQSQSQGAGKKKRKRYTEEEDRRILQCIDKKKAWRFTRTNSLWMQLSNQIFRGERSWQSLRRRYKILNEERGKTKEQLDEEKSTDNNLYTNVCPAIDFKNGSTTRKLTDIWNTLQRRDTSQESIINSQSQSTQK